jgi:hypothetical protein
VQYRLIGADAASDPATIRSAFDGTALMSGADLVLINGRSLSADIGYSAEWGKTTKSQNLHLKMKLAF